MAWPATGSGWVRSSPFPRAELEIAVHAERSLPMNGRIQQLSDVVSNQIAAGEVVERPASLVKELMENSLDAGAHSIEIRSEAGGVKRVRVRDDGSGIHPDDLRLAVSRHATSKILRAEDLEGVTSLGFRGEALASMASVARLAVTSRRPDAGQATRIEVDGGREVSFGPAAHPPGTTVEVSDLFFNTPARRKFLKAERTEQGHIDRVVRSVSLARFDVSLTLDQGAGRGRLSLPAGPAESRLARVMSEDFARNRIEIDEPGPDLRLSGWVGPPTHSRGQADQQYFFVNGRMVRDRLVAHAIRQAFRDVLFHGRHPVFVLYLDLPATAVDVNVHPTKHEVRFRDSRNVHDFVFGKLNRALQGVRPAQHGPPAATVAGLRSGPGSRAGPSQPTLRLHQAMAGAAEGAGGAEAAGVAEAVRQVAEVADTETPPLGYAIAQLHGVYILAENAQGLVVVDMHAAHERITYEKLKAAVAGGQVARQRLLVPEVLDVAETEADLVEDLADELAVLGLVLERSGPQAITIREVPALLAGDAAALVRDVLADVATLGRSQRFQAASEDVLATMA